MTPTLPRRSFLGWTAALGAALLTRPALAVPEPVLTWVVSYKGIRQPWSAVDMLADGLMYDYAMPEAKARETALQILAR